MIALLDTRAAAQYLGVSPSHFRAHIAPTLPRLNVAAPGARVPNWRYRAETLDAWIAARERGPEAA